MEIVKLAHIQASVFLSQVSDPAVYQGAVDNRSCIFGLGKDFEDYFRKGTVFFFTF